MFLSPGFRDQDPSDPPSTKLGLVTQIYHVSLQSDNKFIDLMFVTSSKRLTDKIEYHDKTSGAKLIILFNYIL